MRLSPSKLIVGFLAFNALLAPLSAVVIRLNASLDAAQETTTSTSTATGSATLWYDTAANTFDLEVSLNGFANTISASHVHEGPTGTAGGVVTGLGSESVYTRNGNNLTATFQNLSYGGNPVTLLSGGAYINVHSASFPGGEIRGQFTAAPIKLWAKLTPEQETATVTSDAYGAALMTINPNTAKMDLSLFVYNFTNTLTNSHFHEAPVGSNGGVVHGLGGAAVYNQNGNTYSQVWNDVTYTGNLLTLLNGGAYLNVHSNVYAPGEIRGQLWVSQTTTASRFTNVSSRSAVGAGDAAMVLGFVIEGTEPLQILCTGRGPVLTQFGVGGALADPVLYVYDRWGNQLLWNDNHASATYSAAINQSGFAPTLAAEAAGMLVLPPGPHTIAIKGVNNTTGIALGEAYQVNN